MNLREFIGARCADDAAAGPPHRTICHTNIPVFGHNMPCNCDMPARWRREVKAKRRVLARHVERSVVAARYGDIDLLDPGEGRACDGCHHYRDGWRTPEINDCPELRDLAAPFSDHPDFDPSWSSEATT